MFSTTFKKFYRLGRYLAVDESMIAFMGVLSFKQYMPSKPIKRGIKLWARCDSVTGYMDRFDVYLGKNPQGYIHMG